MKYISRQKYRNYTLSNVICHKAHNILEWIMLTMFPGIVYYKYFERVFSVVLIMEPPLCTAIKRGKRQLIFGRTLLKPEACSIWRPGPMEPGFNQTPSKTKPKPELQSWHKPIPFHLTSQIEVQQTSSSKMMLLLIE